RDLARGLAAADEVQNLQLSIAQALDGIGALLAARDRETLDHARADALAHVDAARENATNRHEQLLGGRLLHDVAIRAGAQEPLSVDVLVVHRQDQHGELLVLVADVLDKLEAVAVAQRQVEDHDVGRELAQRDPRLLHVRSFAAYPKIGLLLDELHEPLTD